MAQAIEEVVNLSLRSSALDVGGGTGRLSILLSDRVGSVVVTDPSAGMVPVARERIEEAERSGRLRAVQADLTTDPLDGAYDAVWSSMALHHVRDLDGLLLSVAGLLVDNASPSELAHAGFAEVNFVDATTILKGDREFGMFCARRPKVHEPNGDRRLGHRLAVVAHPVVRGPCALWAARSCC